MKRFCIWSTVLAVLCGCSIQASNWRDLDGEQQYENGEQFFAAANGHLEQNNFEKARSGYRQCFMDPAVVACNEKELSDARQKYALCLQKLQEQKEQKK